jgi:uncharacterized protein YuzE
MKSRLVKNWKYKNSPKTNAEYITFRKSKIKHSVVLREGLILDLDDKDQVVGLEIIK